MLVVSACNMLLFVRRLLLWHLSVAHTRFIFHAVAWNTGMCSRTTWSRPRPGVFVAKAKATKFCPRGVLEVEASPRGPPSLGFFLPREPRRERLCQVVCLSSTQIQRPTAASCALVYELWSIVFMVLSPLLTILKNSTSYGQISKPKSRLRIVEAKAKARGLRGQGHKILSSSCPRGRGQSSRTPSLVFGHHLLVFTWERISRGLITKTSYDNLKIW